MSATILVVEDNAITRKMLRVTLENAGYLVQEAPDGATALALASQKTPDLVLLDIVLPDSLGPDVATQLQSLAGWADRPILALSGISSLLGTPVMMSEIFADFLLKPIEPSTLLEHVAARLPGLEGIERPGRGRCILVVDDDPVQRKLQRLRLEEAGFVVVGAESGEDALAKARAAPPDAVLSDLLMPGMGGLDFCLALRQDATLARVPVVLTSATYSDIEDEDRQLAAKAGASAFVVRTPSLKEVIEALLEALEQERLTVQVSGQEELRSAFADRLMRQLEAQGVRQASLARQATIAAAQRGILVGVSDVLARRVDLHTALQEILACALDAGDVSVGAVFLLEGGQLRLDCQQGFTDQGARDLARFYGRDAVLRRALAERVPIALPSPRPDAVEQEVLRNAGVSAMVIAPLLASGEPHGVLVMASRGHRPPSDLLGSGRILGAQLGQAVALTRSLTKLAESERHFRELAETVREVFFIMAPDFQTTIYLSPAFEEIWGRSRESVYQSPLSWLEAIHPEDLPWMRERMKLVPEGSDEEYRIVRPDQTIRWVRARAYAARDAAGEVQRIVGTIEDITDRRQLQQQLRVAQKMEAIGRLAAGLAHDFNNLLTVISGHSELLRLTIDADDQRDSLAEITRAVQQASGLTRQLLAFSRQQVLRPLVLNLNTVVTMTVRMLSRIIGEDIEVISDLAPDLGAVRADAGQIEQVLMNLAVNARDAMPQGGRLTIRSANVEVDEAFARRHQGLLPGLYAVLTIADTGSGMAPEVQLHVFEPFYTTKDQGKGTGLGLSTVYGIVKQSGGYISLDSELGTGTTFKIYLPRVADAVDQSVAKLPRHEMRRGTETILLVEDNESVCRVSAQILRRQGYTVLPAADGQKALELSKQYEGPVHLLCTDIVMPGLSGLELAEQIRAQRPNIGVLVTSGYSSIMVGDQGLLKPGSVFLQKPYTITELTERVREALDQSAEAAVAVETGGGEPDRH